MLLLNKVSFESDTRRMSKLQENNISIGIHDVVNDDRFAMRYRAISSTVSHFHFFFFFCCERIITAKQNDGLTSFLMLNVLEARIFQSYFLEGHIV